MEEFRVKIDFSYLKKFKVMDKNNNEVGKVIDFSFNKNYNPTKFILGGSLIEELREDLGLKPDDDPIVPVNLINKIDMNEKKAYLSVDKKELKNKLDREALPPTDKLFSQITKCDVYSKDDQKLGKVVDALFSPNDDVSFVLGDSKFVEFLENVGLLGNYDLLLPSKHITEMNMPNQIKIDQSKHDLTVLLNNEKIGEKEIETSKSKNLKNITRYSRPFGVKSV